MKLLKHFKFFLIELLKALFKLTFLIYGVRYLLESC